MDSRQIAHRAVTRVAEAKGVRPTELAPISDAINPEGLDMLFPAPTDPTRTLQFAYEGYRVTIEHEGEVTVQPLPD